MERNRKRKGLDLTKVKCLGIDVFAACAICASTPVFGAAPAGSVVAAMMMFNTTLKSRYHICQTNYKSESRKSKSTKKRGRLITSTLRTCDSLCAYLHRIVEIVQCLGGDLLLPVYGNQVYTLHNGIEGNDTGNAPLADYHVFRLGDPCSNIPFRSIPNGFHLQEELVTSERARKVISGELRSKLLESHLSMVHKEVR